VRVTGRKTQATHNFLDRISPSLIAAGLSLVRPNFYGLRRIIMPLKTTLLMLSLLATSLFVQTAYAEAAVSVQSQKQNSSQSVILDMQNMTCALCKFTIKKALQGLEGVEDTNVDYDTKTANVTFNPQKTSVVALIKATTDAGYPATVHQASK
jgi:periplasmic mercuric ion binding protein